MRPLTEDEEKAFSVLYESVVEKLVTYIAGATYSGQVEIALGLANLERHIAQAAKELLPLIRGDKNVTQEQGQVVEGAADDINAYIR